MFEGNHAGFYYLYDEGRIKVYAARQQEPMLKDYTVGSGLEEGKVHMLALGRIRLDLEELHLLDQSRSQ